MIMSNLIFQFVSIGATLEHICVSALQLPAWCWQQKYDGIVSADSCVAHAKLNAADWKVVLMVMVMKMS